MAAQGGAVLFEIQADSKGVTVAVKGFEKAVTQMADRVSSALEKVVRQSVAAQASIGKLGKLSGGLGGAFGLVSGSLSIVTKAIGFAVGALFSLTKVVGFSVIVLNQFFSLLGKIAELILGSFNRAVTLLSPIFFVAKKGILETTEAFRRFQIQMEGITKSALRAREVAEFVQQFARETPFRQSQIESIVRVIGLIPATSSILTQPNFGKARKELEELINTIQGLALINPFGVEGALIAFRNAVSGQLVSLERRLDIPAEAVASMIGKTVAELRQGGPVVIEALKAYVNQVVGSGIIFRLGDQLSVQVENIGDALQIAGRKIGQRGFFDFLTSEFTKLSDSVGDFVSDTEKFGPAAQRISDAFQVITESTKRISVSIFSGITSIFDPEAAKQFADNFPTLLASGAASAAEAVATAFAKASKSVQKFFEIDNQGSSKFLQTLEFIFQKIKSTVNAFIGFGSVVKELSGTLQALEPVLNRLLLAASVVVRGLLELIAAGAQGLQAAFALKREDFNTDTGFFLASIKSFFSAFSQTARGSLTELVESAKSQSRSLRISEIAASEGIPKSSAEKLLKLQDSFITFSRDRSRLMDEIISIQRQITEKNAEINKLLSIEDRNKRQQNKLELAEGELQRLASQLESKRILFQAILPTFNRLKSDMEAIRSEGKRLQELSSRTPILDSIRSFVSDFLNGFDQIAKDMVVRLGDQRTAVEKFREKFDSQFQILFQFAPNKIPAALTNLQSLVSESTTFTKLRLAQESLRGPGTIFGNLSSIAEAVQVGRELIKESAKDPAIANAIRAQVEQQVRSALKQPETGQRLISAGLLKSLREFTGQEDRARILSEVIQTFRKITETRNQLQGLAGPEFSGLIPNQGSRNIFNLFSSPATGAKIFAQVFNTINEEAGKTQDRLEGMSGILRRINDSSLTLQNRFKAAEQLTRAQLFSVKAIQEFIKDAPKNQDVWNTEAAALQRIYISIAKQQKDILKSLLDAAAVTRRGAASFLGIPLREDLQDQFTRLVNSLRQSREFNLADLRSRAIPLAQGLIQQGRGGFLEQSQIDLLNQIVNTLDSFPLKLLDALSEGLQRVVDSIKQPISDFITNTILGRNTGQTLVDFVDQIREALLRSLVDTALDTIANSLKSTIQDFFIKQAQNLFGDAVSKQLADLLGQNSEQAQLLSLLQSLDATIQQQGSQINLLSQSINTLSTSIQGLSQSMQGLQTSLSAQAASAGAASPPVPSPPSPAAASGAPSPAAEAAGSGAASGTGGAPPTPSPAAEAASTGAQTQTEGGAQSPGAPAVPGLVGVQGVTETGATEAASAAEGGGGGGFFSSPLFGNILKGAGGALSIFAGIQGLKNGRPLSGALQTVGGILGILSIFFPPLAPIALATSFAGTGISFFGAAEGAVVRARPGGTPVIVGEGGKDEAIIPLGSGAGRSFAQRLAGGSGPGASSAPEPAPKSESKGITIANIVEPRRIVLDALKKDPDIVLNLVATDIGRRGKVFRAFGNSVRQ